MTQSSVGTIDLELSGFVVGGLTADFHVRVSRSPFDVVQTIEQGDKVAIVGGVAAVNACLSSIARRSQLEEVEFVRACRMLGTWLLPPQSRALGLLNENLSRLGESEFLLLRIICLDDQLARIPWEFAMPLEPGVSAKDDNFRADSVLVAHPKLCVVRGESFDTPVQRPQIGSAPRMLFVSSQPEDAPWLRLDAERELIDQVLAEVKPVPRVRRIERANVAALRNALKEASYDIFHYSGHGGAQGGGFLQFEGSAGELDADKLGLLLKEKHVALAVLAACASAAIELDFPWNGIARSLVRVGIPAVVGMQFKVTDASAVEFLGAFYQALGTGNSIGRAMIEGRRALLLGKKGIERDFGVPVLYLRHVEGWDGIAFRPRRSESRLEENIRIAAAYKGLHDELHNAKIGSFILLMELAPKFPPKREQDRRSLQAHANTLQRCGAKLRSIVQEGRCEAAVVTPLLECFDKALHQLLLSLERQDRNAFEDALTRFNSVFGREMSKLDASLLGKAADLPLVGRLSAAHGVDPESARELEGMMAELKELASRHSVCQRLEEVLDDLRQKKSIDGRAVLQKWQDITNALASMLDILDPATAKILAERRDGLHCVLQAPKTGQLAIAFQEFQDVFGMSFWRIDDQLRAICTRLQDDPRLSVMEAH